MDVLEEWQSHHSAHQTEFMSRFSVQAGELDRWKVDLGLQYRAVCVIAKAMGAADDMVARYLNAAWDQAKKSIVSHASIVPLTPRDVQEWGIGLLDQLRLYHGVDIDNILAWTKACSLAWRGSDYPRGG